MLNNSQKLFENNKNKNKNKQKLYKLFENIHMENFRKNFSRHFAALKTHTRAAAAASLSNQFLKGLLYVL